MGNVRYPVCGRHRRRPTLDRNSPRTKNGNAVANPRIRACSPTSAAPSSTLPASTRSGRPALRLNYARRKHLKRSSERAATPTLPERPGGNAIAQARCPSAGAALRPEPVRLGQATRETLRCSAKWRDVLGRSRQSRQNGHTASLPTPAPSPPTSGSTPLAIVLFCLKTARREGQQCKPCRIMP